MHGGGVLGQRGCGASCVPVVADQDYQYLSELPPYFTQHYIQGVALTVINTNMSKFQENNQTDRTNYQTNQVVPRLSNENVPLESSDSPQGITINQLCT